ncbi:MAG: hypothetical protein GY757_21495 [bacterium]|nr:hypothetical protein [bacterium]
MKMFFKWSNLGLPVFFILVIGLFCCAEPGSEDVASNHIARTDNRKQTAAQSPKNYEESVERLRREISFLGKNLEEILLKGQFTEKDYFIHLDYEQRLVRVIIAPPGIFKPHSIVFQGKGTGLLKTLLPVMKETVYDIIIHGNISRRPVKSSCDSSNWELIPARTGRIARFLIETGNLHPGRFSITAGSKKPTKTQKDPTGPLSGQITIIFVID